MTNYPDDMPQPPVSKPAMSLAERQLELMLELIRCDVPLHLLAPILRSLADQWQQPAVKVPFEDESMVPATP